MKIMVLDNLFAIVAEIIHKKRAKIALGITGYYIRIIYQTKHYNNWPELPCFDGFVNHVDSIISYCYLVKAAKHFINIFRLFLCYNNQLSNISRNVIECVNAHNFIIYTSLIAIIVGKLIVSSFSNCLK